MIRRLSAEKLSNLPSDSAPEWRQLEGALIALEPLDPGAHGRELFTASHESGEAKHVWTYLPDGPFEDFASFDGWLRRMMSAADRLSFALRDKHAKRLGGMATFLEIRPAMRTVEMGYIWFAPFLQRTRQGTEALFLMLSYAFDELGYRRMQWRCNALNQSSRTAASRLGFTFEGISYQHMIVKGANRDTAWYSILDHEWPRIRSNFERWLASSNFDAEGRQRLSLKSLNTVATG